MRICLQRRLILKRGSGSRRSTRAAWTEKVLKCAKQPTLEIPFLGEESISSSLFSHCFRNGRGIRSDDDDGGRMLTLLDVLCRVYAIEIWQVDIHQNQIGRQRGNLPQRL